MSLLGIDLHSNRIIVARLAVKSETVETVMSTYTFERDSFQRFLDSLRQTDYVLVENTFNAFWFHDQIAGRVKECLVFNTNEARNEGNKSDKIDARKLAKKLGYYLMMGERREDLPTVYVVARNHKAAYMRIPVKVATHSGNKLPLTPSSNFLPPSISEWQF
jgi:hypothetical protein